MIKLKSLLTESLQGKTLISVDVQPDYEDYIGFNLENYVNFINNEYEGLNDLVFLYNGSETIGNVDEHDYNNWLHLQGVREDILDSAKFYDKGYAYFRYCMDEGIDSESVANFVRFMYENNIHSSYDMDRDAWSKYLRQYRRTDKQDLYKLLERSDDCVHIPPLMKYLSRFNNIVLVGGSSELCLKEVEIALMALKKNYSIFNQFTY